MFGHGWWSRSVVAFGVGILLPIVLALLTGRAPGPPAPGDPAANTSPAPGVGTDGPHGPAGTGAPAPPARHHSAPGGRSAHTRRASTRAKAPK